MQFLPVVGDVRPHRRSEGKVFDGGQQIAGTRGRETHAELRVIIGGIGIHDPLKAFPRGAVAAGLELGPSQRLENAPRAGSGLGGAMENLLGGSRTP